MTPHQTFLQRIKPKIIKTILHTFARCIVRYFIIEHFLAEDDILFGLNRVFGDVLVVEKDFVHLFDGVPDVVVYGVDY